MITNKIISNKKMEENKMKDLENKISELKRVSKTDIDKWEKVIEDVEKDDKGVYVVSGPRIDRMLGYTNLESERGFDFFQKFMKENGVIERLTEMGIEEGDTVRLYNLEFDYYR